MADGTDAPEAMWFGRRELRSFGVLHRPAAPTGHGVVLCNALGFEGLLAHRPLRHLATELAAAGHTALRLDYESTGDAPGDGSAPPSLDACIDGVLDAVALLVDRSGCTSVSLVGIRAGATVAALAGLRHPGLRDLVLWAPCEKGSTYVRELRALSRLAAASRVGGTDGPAEGRLEVVGFEFEAALLDDLRGVELARQITGPPADRILLLERDDIGANEDFVQALKSSGASFSQAVSPRWAEFMVSDETMSVMPATSLATITAWLGEPNDPATHAAERLATPDGEGPLVVSTAYERAGVAERAVWIDDRLFAIVAEPTAHAAAIEAERRIGADRRQAPERRRIPERRLGRDRRQASRRQEGARQQVVVMPNTGSVNRTGPGRLYTHLGRTWAAQGVKVVRVDLGGTGDSATLGGEAENQPYAPARIDELRDVIAWAHRTFSPDELDLYGICSGAYQSFHAALLGAQVSRAILVNPAIFYLGPDQTVGSSTSKAMMASHNLWRAQFIRSQMARALRSPGELPQFARRAGRGLRYTAGAWGRRGLRRLGFTVTEREHLDRDLRRLAADDVDLLFVFAAGEPGLHYLNVFGSEALSPRGDPARASVLEIVGGDHVFSPPQARQAMATAVTQYLLATDPPSMNATPSAPQG